MNDEKLWEIIGGSAVRALAAHYAAYPNVPVRPELTMVEVDGFAEFYLVLTPYTIDDED